MTLTRFFRQAVAFISPVFLFLCSTPPAGAQPAQSADKILAIIGRSRIILQSDLEQTAAQASQQNGGAPFTDSMKCQLLQQMIMQKMLVEQAERDSLLISEEEVEGTLENRIRYFTRMYGTKERLEQITGKTIYQMKEENRDVVKEQMMAERMQGKLLQNVKITPSEVQAFYRKIPVDSLPFFPATVEVGQIVIDPPTNPELDQYARQQLDDIRRQIVTEGKSFETMAGLYSMDPGSRDNGGRIDGVTRDGGLVQEFISAAFRLQNGEISPVFKTRFGYHIIQMVQRKGEQVDVRHILIIPQHVPADYEKAASRLDSVRAQLISGNLTFPQAVSKYSTDDASRMTGGMIADPRTNTTQMEVDQLDPDLALMIDSLKPGAFSQPKVFRTAQGEQSVRIVYLKTRTEPHKANLKDDYSRIQAVALSQKQNEKLEAWITAKLPTYYLKIDPQYSTCGTLRRWSERTAGR